MWRVGDCSTHGFVFYHLIIRLNRSIFSKDASFYQPWLFSFLVAFFYLSLPAGDKFSLPLTQA